MIIELSNSDKDADHRPIHGKDRRALPPARTANDQRPYQKASFCVSPANSALCRSMICLIFISAMLLYSFWSMTAHQPFLLVLSRRSFPAF